MKTATTPADLENTRAAFAQDITEAERKLEASENTLVGQGFCCVLERGGMALTRNGEVTHLIGMRGHLGGVLHYSRADAIKVCERWNANLTEAQQCVRVRPMHYTDALREVIATARGVLELFADA